jgi:hypothetical protein
MSGKLLTMREAIRRFVADGDTVMVEGYLPYR